MVDILQVYPKVHVYYLYMNTMGVDVHGDDATLENDLCDVVRVQ